MCLNNVKCFYHLACFTIISQEKKNLDIKVREEPAIKS